MSVRRGDAGQDRVDGQGTAARGLRSRLARIASGTVVAGLVASSLALAAPAYAADAAVMVKTQRMKDANLNSGQVGWYEKGSKVTLLCWKRGQKVKGYFSFNIPNGGWDDLWYRTSDNNYVADVDIQTNTLNAVGPDCGTFDAPKPQTGPAPAQQAGRTQGAVSTKGPNPLAAFYGECTYGAQEELKKRTGYYIPVLNKAAKLWDDIAQQNGWQVKRDGPAPKSIVVFEPGVQYADATNGHVSWVDDVIQINGKPAIAITDWNYKGQRFPVKRTVTHVPGMSYILIP